MVKADAGTPWGGRFRPIPDRRILPEDSPVPALTAALRDALMDELLQVQHKAKAYDPDKEPTIRNALGFFQDRIQHYIEHTYLIELTYEYEDIDCLFQSALCFNEATQSWFREGEYKRFTKDMTPAKRKKFDQEERDRRIASARLLARAAKRLRDEESDKDLVAVHEIYDQEDWDLAMATVQSGDIVQLANELDAKIEYRGDPFDPDANTGEPITFTMTREGPPQ